MWRDSSFGGTFLVIVVDLIQHKMVEDKHGIDEVEVAGKRALHSVIDDSVISERIVALKRSKAVDLMSTLRITSFYLRFEAKLTV